MGLLLGQPEGIAVLGGAWLTLRKIIDVINALVWMRRREQRRAPDLPTQPPRRGDRLTTILANAANHLAHDTVGRGLTRRRHRTELA